MNDLLQTYLKGVEGESKVEQLLKSAGVLYIKNLLLRFDDTICQIDFVVITENGLLCVEVKNYKDCIVKGSLNSKVWTNIYWNQNVVNQNPIHQNNKHIEVLNKYIHWDGIIQNVILCNIECNLDLDYDVLKNNENVTVGYFNDIFKVLTICKNEGNKLSKKMINTTYKYLRKLAEENTKYYEEHLKIFK